jgi:hypothetical protein
MAQVKSRVAALVSSFEHAERKLGKAFVFWTHFFGCNGTCIHNRVFDFLEGKL